MKPLLLSGHRWVFRGYDTLDDFVHNKNCLYASKDCPKKNQGKYVYILSKYFFDSYVSKDYWGRFESSEQFDDVTFIYEDHQDDPNIDYRWFEVMRRWNRGVYIKDVAPLYFSNPPIRNGRTPIMLASPYLIYDKWRGKPFGLYGFDDPDSHYRKYPTDKKDIDVLFIGKRTSRRYAYIKKVIEASNELGIHAVIRKAPVPFKKHAEFMRRSKISYHFMALGYRSSREWEAMINGSLLISDDRTVDHIVTPGMEVDKDFVKFDPVHTVDQIAYWLENEDKRNEMCQSAFKTAWDMWNGCHDPYMPSRRIAAQYIRVEK